MYLLNREKLFHLATIQLFSSKELRVFVHILTDKLVELQEKGEERQGKEEEGEVKMIKRFSCFS